MGMTVAEYRAMLAGDEKPKARSKYHNRACRDLVDDLPFASRKELRRWNELKTLQQAGTITDLQRQVRFQFPLPDGTLLRYTPSNRAVTYIADFVYTENGQRVVEDAKGMRTDVYKIKAALMLGLNGIKIREV